ncbi:MAG: DUF1972 domain-containing protein [Bacteroidales bacterium]|nr:DUF1972 domain-containing protein [Bacteroidales bacterium]
MKIAIVGTKGIPNAYGGFEAFAENISVRLAAKGFAVTVFQPHQTTAHLEPFESVARFGVKVFGLLPQNLQRVQYNLSTLHNLKHQNFDVALCCGHSPSIFLPFFSRRFRHHLVVNMDGLEWKREKWGFFARSMLKLSEMLAVKFCNTLVADSQAIQLYLINQYNKKSVYIPYGANDDEVGLDDVVLEKHSLRPMEYGLLIARIEPENRIEQALKAFNALNKKLVVVGGLETPYGKAIMKRFSGFKNVVFAGGVYNQSSLNTLRKYCRVYYHGHTVGGTNPSLLDAMAAGCMVVASDNVYNRETLNHCGFFFNSPEDLLERINEAWNADGIARYAMAKRCIERVKEHYTWSVVVDRYVNLFNSLTNEKA